MRAKQGKPLRFSLLVPVTSAARKSYAILIQAALHQLGADVEISTVDIASYGAKTQPGKSASDFDAALHSFNTDPSPSGLKQIWGTDGASPDGLNLLLYSNPKVDALFDSLAASFDPAKVKEYTKRALQAVVDDVPAVWLYDQNYMDAVNRRVTVGPIRADGWWNTLGTWSIPADKRIDRDRFGLTPAPAAR
jgi:peptide/nickel transport system substrate-binding protein